MFSSVRLMSAQIFTCGSAWLDFSNIYIFTYQCACSTDVAVSTTPAGGQMFFWSRASIQPSGFLLGSPPDLSRQDAAAAHPAVATEAVCWRQGILMVVIISSCLWFSRKGGRGCKEKKERERVQRKCKKGEEEGMREVNVSVWAVTVRYLRAPQRRAQAALVQVLLVCRVMLCLSVCLFLTHTVSLSQWLVEEWVLFLAGPLGHNE